MWKHKLPPELIERHADDLAQKVLWLLLERVHDPKKKTYGQPGPLLMATIVNSCRNLKRAVARGRWTEVDLDASFEALADNSPAQTGEVMLLSTSCRAVAAAFERNLETDCRELLTLRVLDGLAYAEISKMLQRSKEYLRRRAYKCRQMLRAATEHWQKQLDNRPYTADEETIWNIIHAKTLNP
jgi:RNA polymerase sigma factor (sigma-70 family)